MVDEDMPVIANDEPAVDPAPEPMPEPMPEISAAHRLRAFEDEHLGEDTPRVEGRIERGHGSRLQTKLTAEGRAEHAALERLVHAEEELMKATAALGAAQAKHSEAATAVERASDAHEAVKVRKDGDAE